MQFHPLNWKEPLIVDPALWVTLKGKCKGKHYLLHNPHTFIGRIAVYCVAKNRVANISKQEIRHSSAEAAYWLKGYLAGCEPSPSLSKTGESLPFDDPRMATWREAISLFAESGFWYRGQRECERCGRSLLPSRLGMLCGVCSAETQL